MDFQPQLGRSLRQRPRKPRRNATRGIRSGRQNLSHVLVASLENRSRRTCDGLRVPRHNATLNAAVNRSELPRGAPPERRTRLKDGPAPKRTTRIPVKGRDRFAFRRDNAYREALRAETCWLAVSAQHTCTSISRFHHLITKGTGGFDYANGAALCDGAHDAVHRLGWVAIWEIHGVNLWEDAVRFFHRWLERAA